MKRVKTNLTTLVVALVVMFTACDKDVETSGLELNKDKSATIRGYVYAELDKTSAGVEMAPAGTLIAVKIANSDYKTGVAGAYTDTVAVSASGTFSIEVPADDDGVTVNITAIPFEAAQVTSYGTYEESVTKIYTATVAPVSVSSGDVIIQQITYSAADFTNFVPMVEISGRIYAELNDTLPSLGVSGSEELEMSVELTFYTDEWVEVLTTNGDGTFTVVVPKGQSIKVDGYVVADAYVVAEDDEIEMEFELDGATVGTYNASTEDVAVDFGEGTVVE